MKIGDVFVVNLVNHATDPNDCHRFTRELVRVEALDEHLCMVVGRDLKMLTHKSVLGVWNEKDQADAAAEGWEMFKAVEHRDDWLILPTHHLSWYHGNRHINPDDMTEEQIDIRTMMTFTARLVFQKAREGSLLHLKAIIHIRTQSMADYESLVEMCE